MGKRAVRFNSSAISDALKFSSGCALKKDSKSRLCLVIYMATPPSCKETPKMTIRFYDKHGHNAQSDHDLISASLIFIICQSSSVCKWKTKNRFPRQKNKEFRLTRFPLIFRDSHFDLARIHAIFTCPSSVRFRCTTENIRKPKYFPFDEKDIPFQKVIHMYSQIYSQPESKRITISIPSASFSRVLLKCTQKNVNNC